MVALFECAVQAISFKCPSFSQNVKRQSHFHSLSFTLIFAVQFQPDFKQNSFIQNVSVTFLVGFFVLQFNQELYTAEKMKLSIKDFFSKCDQIRRFYTL